MCRLGKCSPQNLSNFAWAVVEARLPLPHEAWLQVRLDACLLVFICSVLHCGLLHLLVHLLLWQPLRQLSTITCQHAVVCLAPGHHLRVCSCRWRSRASC